MNVVHVAVHYDDPITWGLAATPDPEDVATELDTKLGTVYRALVPTTGVWHSLTVTDEVDPQDPTRAREGFELVKELAGTRTGSTADEPAPLCLCVTLKTAHIGRSFRGRFYAPPCVYEGEVVTGTFTSGGDYYINTNNFMKQLVPTFGGGSAWSSAWIDTWHGSVVVYSRTRRARGDDDWASPITAYRLNKDPRWLRSRAH